MPIVNGKRVLSSSPENQANINARGGINRTSNAESTGVRASGSTGFGSQTVAPTTPPAIQGQNVPITSASLAPVATATLGTPKTAIQGATLASEAVAGADEYTKGLQEQAKNLQTGSSTAFDSYINQLKSAQGVTSLTNDAYSVEGGVDSITPELNDINDKIRQEQRSLDLATRAISEAGGGLKAGAAAEVANLERISYQKQADLSIIQMAVQGRYDSAKEIADRAVSAKLEQQTNALEVAKFNYTENKELFTKAEQRAFEAEQGDRERALAAEKENLDNIYALAIQAQQDGAPTSVVQKMMSAKTKEEAAGIGGSYIGALDREAKRASIRSASASAALNEQQLIDVQAKNKQIQESIDAGKVVLDEAQQGIAFKLGNEFTARSTDFKKQVDAYNRIIASAEDPSAAGDLALIFNYMKMLDPGSTVREGEFATAQNAAGVPARIRAQMNSVINGEKLADTQRNDFVDRSSKLYDTSLDQQMVLEDSMRQQATDVYGLPAQAADLIISDIRASGAVSEVVFGLTLNKASDEQLIDLKNRGLIQ